MKNTCEMTGANIQIESEHFVCKRGPSGKLVTLRRFDVQFTITEQRTPNIFLLIGAREESLMQEENGQSSAALALRRDITAFWSS